MTSETKMRNVGTIGYLKQDDRHYVVWIRHESSKARRVGIPGLSDGPKEGDVWARYDVLRGRLQASWIARKEWLVE